MILEAYYLHYFSALLDGNKEECTKVINNLINEKVDIKDIYTQIIKRSMYRIGQMWENDKTTIAAEHRATKITEIIINQIYPYIQAIPKHDKKVIVTCADKEFHELGARMVSDIFELNGWNSTFLGANTPSQELLNIIQDVKPDVVAISINFYINIVRLLKEIEMISENFPDLKIIVGGQAFSDGKEEILSTYPNVKYINCLYLLENLIKQ